MNGLERLSLNQATTHRWGALEAIDACARHDIGFIGLWRDKVDAAGAERVRRRLDETGVRVSSLCRGGFFTGSTSAARRTSLEDNRRAIDGAASLGADVLVLVCGGVAGRDIDGSRRMVVDALAALAPYAAERGVTLGIEPLHPMFAGDRSVVNTLAQAHDMAREVGSSSVGVVLDAYHVWWDPELYRSISAAAGSLVGFHVDDWLAPPPDVLHGRGMMGEGIIELRRIADAVQATGYEGPIEVEVFNRELWARPGDEVLAEMKDRFREHVLGEGGEGEEA